MAGISGTVLYGHYFYLKISIQWVGKMYMVEYCEFFKMAFAKILDFWHRLKTRYEAPKQY